MAIRDALRLCGNLLHADVEETPTGIVLEFVLGRRETGAHMRQLRYRIQLDIDEGGKTVYFSECLWERGDTPVVDLGAALAPKEETFRVGPPRHMSGVLERQARLFQKRYGSRFDVRPIRNEIARMCGVEGYNLRHLIPLD